MVFENDIPMSSSPAVKYPSSLRMNSSCSLCVALRFASAFSASLGGTRQADFAVPLARVTAREVVPTILAEVYCERVRLHALAVPLEFAPLLELGVGTESALDLANRPACPVGLRRHE